LHVALVDFFGYRSQIYLLTKPPVNLLNLAISHSGVNDAQSIDDVSPLRHLFHRASSTKLLISGVPGCMCIKAKAGHLFEHLLYRPLSWSNLSNFSEPLTGFRGRQHTESFIFMVNVFSCGL